jgi:peptidoglycan/xylan/chitin deacetylase (PgdA/CDA1 family)
MRQVHHGRYLILLLGFLTCILLGLPARAADFYVPVLVYHRFAPTSQNLYTVSLQEFEGQMRYLKENGYQVIPLRSLVDFYLGKGAPPPPQAVVITIDDGHTSVYSYAFPILKKYGYPATLFIYPCCIGRVSYALTWEQIRELADQGLEIGSHTRYHPNFKVERRRLKPQEYEEFVEKEMTSSKRILEEKLGRSIRYLSYPFGVHDEVLENKAFQAGYQAMFTIMRQGCDQNSSRGALPRFLIEPHTSTRSFSYILSPQSPPGRAKAF